MIHALTVRAPGGRSSAENVCRATEASLEKACEAGIKLITYPLMGAGVSGSSPEESVRSIVGAFESWVGTQHRRLLKSSLC